MVPISAPRLLAFAAAAAMLAGAASLWFASDHGAAGAAPAPLSADAPPAAPSVPPDPPIVLAVEAPEPAKSREEQRFARADRDDDGRIAQAEYLATRRRNYAKLDSNGDGRLSFEEYAASGIEKFETADANGDGALQAAEFATLAPKPKKPGGSDCVKAPEESRV